MSDRSNEPLNNLSVRKSNDFISAKYCSTLLENQVMAIALTRIEVNATENETSLEARLYPGELRKLVSDPAHIYRDLKKLAKSIIGHTMFLEDGKGNFRAFSVVPNADYLDGVFIIKFNDVLKNHVLGLEKNYTSLELSLMTDFRRNSSFRLYEILKKEAYKIPKSGGDYIEVVYNLSELRFMIGLANSDDQRVKNAMSNMGRNVDWDKLYEGLDKKDKKYEEWRDFQRRILKPAQEELQEKSDIRFEYEGQREGRRISRILFRIYYNTPKNPEVIDERARFLESNSRAYRQMEMPRDLPEFKSLYEDFVGHNELAIEDIDLMIKKSEFNAELVRSAITMADEQPYLDNYMGWIISYIKNGGYERTEVAQGNHAKAVLIKELQEQAHSRETKQRVWEKIKTKEDFARFLVYEEKTKGITFDELDIVYEPEDASREYIEWTKAGKINYESV